MSVSIASFRLTGLSPLLMNNPASMEKSKDGLGTKKIPTYEQECIAKVYRDGEGRICIPTMAIRSSLLGACAGRRIGKVGARTVIQAAVFNVSTNALLFDPETLKLVSDYRIFVARCVIQRQGVLKARPEFPRWACNVDFELDNEFKVGPELISELLNIAGKVCGLLDWRPNKKGVHGRFKAEVVANEVAAKAA